MMEKKPNGTEPNKRLINTFRVLGPLVKPVMKLMFRYDYETIPEMDGPILLLCNHNTDFDCILAGLAMGRQIYFVATEKVTRMGLLGKIVKRYFDPILHSKGVQGIGTVRSILTKMRNGSSVAMFPEGNRSFNGLTCPIPPATAKLARSCGGTLVTYRFSGGYFSWPRWGKGLRRGRLTGRIAGVYGPQQLKAMSEQEIAAVIAKDLFVDAYQDQEKQPVAFRARNRARGMDSMLYLCPACGQLGRLHTEKDSIICSCGWSAEYDVYGYLNEKGGKRWTLTQLDALQRKKIDAMVDRDPQELLFSDQVTREVIAPDHSIVSTTQETLSAYADRLVLGEAVIPFTRLEGIAINQRNLLLLHTAGEELHDECSGPVSFNALKYLYLVRASQGSRTGTL